MDVSHRNDHIEQTIERPEDKRLGAGANLVYGLQHVLTMYGGIVAVPLIIGQAAGLSPADIGLLITASLFAGGLATILQTIGIAVLRVSVCRWCRAFRSPASLPWWRSSPAAKVADCRR